MEGASSDCESTESDPEEDTEVDAFYERYYNGIVDDYDRYYS